MKRMLLALFLGTIFVLVILITGAKKFYLEEEPIKILPKSYQLDHLSEQETRELFKHLGIPWDPKPTAPDLNVPTYKPLVNDVKGFVYVNVSVNPDGSVDNAEIVGSTHAGVYEDQARTHVLTKKYQPRIENGSAIAYQTDEIVEFDLSEQAQ